MAGEGYVRATGVIGGGVGGGEGESSVMMLGLTYPGVTPADTVLPEASITISCQVI